MVVTTGVVVVVEVAVVVVPNAVVAVGSAVVGEGGKACFALPLQGGSEALAMRGARKVVDGLQQALEEFYRKYPEFREGELKDG